MLYHVDIKVAQERHKPIDDAGGPGAFFGHMMERFKPQAFYFCIGERRVLMIVELDTPAKIIELTLLAGRMAGTDAKLTPIAPIADAPKLIGEAMQNVAKAPKI